MVPKAQRVVAAIPARIRSERLPGKPLLELGGTPMISHVVRAARKAPLVTEVLVATDDEAVAKVAALEGAATVMTDSALPSGSDRIEAGMRASGMQADIVVNVQGDEPLMDPMAINLAAELLLADRLADMSTLCAPLPHSALRDTNKVKVVCREESFPQGRSGHMTTCPRHQLVALFFSRAPIGLDRTALEYLLNAPGSGADEYKTLAGFPQHACALHLGVYGFRREALSRFVALSPSPLERLERLEQMRAVEAGMRIVVGKVAHAPVGVDTADDLQAARGVMRTLHEYQSPHRNL